MRILLVDDDTGVIQALLAVLKTLPGHEVKVATSGEKALEHAATMGGVDLLITDVVMDPMDGFTLCTQMMERYPSTRTIFISGYDLSEYADSLQHYQVLQKPITAEAFLVAVQRELAPRPVATPVAATARAVAAAPRAVAVASAGQPVAVATATAQPRAVAVAQPVATAYASEAPTGLAAETSLSDSDSSAGLIGHVIGGYQIVTQLGEGRWGTVYAAVQTSINRPVGLKVLDPVRARDDRQKQRFIADARAKAHVQHPSILAVYEAGAASGWIFYTHEYVDGHNLAELAQARRTLDEPTILKLLRVIADGFIYLTRNNVAHAPLEAGDIYLSVDGQPRLANLATSSTDSNPSVEQEISSLGRALDPLASANISLGLRALLNRMVEGGPGGISAWGALLQAVKALEPKIVPIEAAKISAQDRATSAAVEAARKQQKRSFVINVASMVSLVLLTGFVIWWKFGSNERTLDEQIEIPAGPFLFGPNGTSTEVGQFWIDKYEVTIGQYAKFVEFIEKHPEREKDYDHPDQPPKHLGHVPKDWAIYYGQAKVGGAAHSSPISLNSPMLALTWWDAYAYAKWRGRDLPTEQEWEKAARGKRGYLFPWGDKEEEKRANTGEDHKKINPAAKGEIDGFNYWSDVDALQKDVSEYGVVGMAGNVSEWTADWNKKKTSPIVKGGNFATPLQQLHSRIDNLEPNTVAEHIGFRTISRKPPGSN